MKSDLYKGNKIVNLRICEIKANSAQPRNHFEKEAILRLADSIEQNGLLQPLSVRKNGKAYELIAGERRLRALKELKYEKVPCIVVNADDSKSAVLAIVENIQRENLNVFEEAQGIEKLISRWGVSQSEAAERLGLSQSAVANKLRLLRLSEKEKELIIKYKLSERHARSLIRISDEALRKKALAYIIYKKLNVEQTEKYVNRLVSNDKKGETRLVFKDLRIFMNTINMAIDTMRRSGIMASAEKGETENYIEYNIKIPKPSVAK